MEFCLRECSPLETTILSCIKQCMLILNCVRAPELLLGTKYYNPSIDLWSGGLVLAELLLSTPCLTGETPIEQLSLITKLLGSPTPDDLASFSSMGCPDLIKWRRESLAAGRADNIERRFLAATSPETVTFLKGLLKWNPHARWTAAEALGLGRSRYASLAERWWQESPRGVDKELLPTFPESRNGVNIRNMTYHSRADLKGLEDGNVTLQGGERADYVFDFGEESGLRRRAKRPRVR